MEDDKRKKKSKKKKNKQQQQQQQATNNTDSSSNASDARSGQQSDVDPTTHVSTTVRSNGHIETSSDQPGKENLDKEEVRLRDMVKQLFYEKNSFIEKQADLTMNIKQLMCERDSWHEKKANMEQRISKLLQEKASLSLEERNLQEKVNHIEKEKAVLMEKENMTNEMIGTLSDENRRLRMQVAELEGHKTNFSQENKQLIDNISTLQSRIKDLEATLASVNSTGAEKGVQENADLKAEVEAAFQLIEKLVTENADLVEKLNELYKEHGSSIVTSKAASVDIPDMKPEASEDTSSSSATSIKPYVGVQVEVSDIDTDYAAGNLARHSSETTVSGEIVQIPLDEYDVEARGGASVIEEDEAGVPLTDAPITGAPFRFISFVARYVSGADLVQQDGLHSTQ